MAEVDYEDIELHERLRAARAVIAQQKAEIERLRAEVERKADHAERMDALAEERLIGWNAERALADQLAVALLGTASGRIIPTDDEWAGVVKMRSAALDAWEARRG